MKLVKSLALASALALFIGFAAPVSAQAVTLHGFGLTSGYTEVMEQITEDYKAETGVILEWEIANEDYAAILKTRFAADEAPDIFDLQGNLIDWAERAADLSGSEFIDHLLDSSKEYIHINDQYLAMPYALEASGIIYNKDLFEQAGIAEFPRTLDELEAAAKKLKEHDIRAFGEAWKEWGFLMHILGTPFAYEKDLKGVSEKLKSGEMKLKDLAYMDNFFRLFDLTLDYGLGVESIGFGVMDQVPDFASGKMAMIKQGTWLDKFITQLNPGIRMGLAAVPLNDNPEDAKLMVATTRYFVVNKDSAVAKEAQDFLNWLYRNMQKYFVSRLNIIAPYDTIMVEGLGVLNEDMFAYAEAGMTYPSFGTDEWPTGFEVDIAEPLQAYAADQLDQEGTLNELQRLYDSRLNTGN